MEIAETTVCQLLSPTENHSSKLKMTAPAKHLDFIECNCAFQKISYHLNLAAHLQDLIDSSSLFLNFIFWFGLGLF